EYVVEGSPPLAAGPVAMQDDLAGMSFAEVVRSLQLRLDLPELELFDVQGNRGSIPLQGRPLPIGIGAAPARPGPPAAAAAAPPRPPSRAPPAAGPPPPAPPRARAPARSCRTSPPRAAAPAPPCCGAATPVCCRAATAGPTVDHAIDVARCIAATCDLR